ncbi:ThiF family protein [Nonomuraea polychroma]|uniref:ThiF family protein n=1 Tax=Nonomuraea polychroma TaxID=46176 RepID=A0A438MFC1_9ACTN|nr:ThiF family protein [Nonomuraea polychroma]
MKPALRRIIRDEHTLQYGVHPLRAIKLSGLARSVQQWIAGLDGTRDLARVLAAASAAGLDECHARSLLDQLTAQGALHDAATSPAPLRDLTLAERDRLRPDLEALDLSSTAPDGGIGLLARRRAARVRVYGAGRVGAQIVVLLAAAGVGHIRVIDSGRVRASDITPGGLTWAELGLTREEGAVAAALRLTSGGRAVGGGDDMAADQRHSDQPQGNPRSAARTPRPIPSPAIPVPAPDRATRTPTTATPPPDRAIRTPTTTTPPPDRAVGTPATTTPPSDRAVRTPATAMPASGARTRQEGSAGQRRSATHRPPETSHTADLRDTEAVQGNAGRRGGGREEGEGAQPAPRRKRTGRRIDGQELVRPAVEVLAGGTYLGDRSDRPDLVILAPVGPMDGVLVNELTCLGIPHLLASAFEGHGTVGPLVLPGETACLHCLDLTRRDDDPAWPIVTARLGGYPPGEIACDTTLATLVAAEATGHALAHLDGKESSVTNGTMDVSPDWRWNRQAWRVHPQCRCMRNNPYSLRMVMSPKRD